MSSLPPFSILNDENKVGPRTRQSHRSLAGKESLREGADRSRRDISHTPPLSSRTPHVIAQATTDLSLIPPPRHGSTQMHRPSSPTIPADLNEKMLLAQAHSASSAMGASCAASSKAQPPVSPNTASMRSKSPPLAVGTMSSGRSRTPVIKSERWSAGPRPQLGGEYYHPIPGSRPDLESASVSAEDDPSLPYQRTEDSGPQQRSGPGRSGPEAGPSHLASPSRQYSRASRASPPASGSVDDDPYPGPHLNEYEDPVGSQKPKREKVKGVLKGLHLWKREDERAPKHGASPEPEGRRSRKRGGNGRNREEDVEHIVVQHWTEQD